MLHPTALVAPGASIAEDAEIGPWCVVEAGAAIGPRARLGPFCQVHAGARLEEAVVLDSGAVIGGAPQDQKYGGAPTPVRIGPGARVGAYATVNRASRPGGETVVGAGALVMAYAHVAHDCVVGDRAILANAVQLGGHARIGEGAIVSGMTGIHQFTTIGAGAFVGGGLRVDQDVPPFCRAMGDPLRWGGLNLTGLRRLDAEAGVPGFLDAFYRRLQADEGSALAWMREQPGFGPEKRALEEFFAVRSRGLLRRGASRA